MMETVTHRPTSLFWVLVGSSVILNLLLWILVVFLFPQESPAAVLHYVGGIGVDFVGEGEKIVMLPIIGIVLFVVDMIVGVAIRPLSERSAWALFSSMPLLQIVLLLAFFLLWRVNV